MKTKPMKQKMPVAPTMPVKAGKKPEKMCGCKKGGVVSKKKC